MLRTVQDLIRRGWAAFRLRRDLPWVLFLGGLLLTARNGGGCLATGLLWLGGWVLFWRGFLWVWRKLLFRVSRRLWVILALMSVLPVLGLGVLLTATSWLGLGAQVSRATQQNLLAWQEALSLANQEPSDMAAIQVLKSYGTVRAEHVPSLPEGVPGTFLGLAVDLVDAEKTGQVRNLFLRTVRKEAAGYRVLSLPVRALRERSQGLSGGRIQFRITPKRELKAGVKGTIRVQSVGGTVVGEAPILVGQPQEVAHWTEGQPLEGSGLFRPFDLPPQAFNLVDWKTGRALVLTATPETNLYSLFAGYKSAKGQSMSEGAVKAIVVVALILMGLLVAQAVAALMGLSLAWSLGRAINELHRGVLRLTHGDFDTRIRPRGRDQVTQLTESFNEMAARLQIADSEKEERLRMEEELRVAREVQMRLLPDLEALGVPSVRATILPAREVAGDYFDVFPLPDGSLAFLIADVSGKGTSAAFYAAETKGVLSALDKQTLGPVEVADRLNTIWCQGHGRRLFLTLAYGTFHPRTGRYQFVRAGHPSAFLRRADGRVLRLHPQGMGVGLSAGRFKEALELCEGTLEPGDSLIFYTDGLTEAQAPDDSFYGEDRLEALLGQPSEDLLASILGDALAFAQGRSFADDLTLLILRR
jgi:serine phosphatase RsbU (regulator of sigma subunit)